MASFSIVCEDLTWQINSHKHIIQSLNTRFQGGQITALLGPNGAGKSSLFHLLSKAQSPTHGQILFNQQPLSQWSYANLAKQRAVLLQKADVAFSISVEQCVHLGAQVQSESLSAQQQTQLVTLLLHRCDLHKLAQRDMLTLSGGEQQRAHLARVLAQILSPQSVQLSDSNTKIAAEADQDKAFLHGKWLFLDEWTAGLDWQHQQLFSVLWQQLSQQGLGIIMAVHDFNLALALADQVTLLQKGQTVASGPTATVLTQQCIEKEFAIQVEALNNQQGKPVAFFPKIT